MLDPWVFLALLLIVGLVLPGVAIFANWVLSPKKPNPIKQSTYECGIETVGETWVQLKGQYYIFALLFLVFDIEAVFIYPWAVVFSDSARGEGKVPALWAVVEIAVFVGVILVGLAYAWRKGALEWGPTRPTGLEEGETEH